MSALLREIAREITYPSTVPVVATLSQRYYCIYPDLNLLLVPLGERSFLLHLPDLYHELGHPLLEDENDPVVAPFRDACERIAGAAEARFRTLAVREARGHGPRPLAARLENVAASWLLFWPKEFFCDLFAAAVLGPAYDWAHLHLFAKRGSEPFFIPSTGYTSHPADAARMDMIIRMLRRQGYLTKSDAIRTAWNMLLATLGHHPSPDHRICHPDDLLDSCVDEARSALADMRCRLAQPGTTGRVHDLLNEAWSRLQADPDGFAAWEKKAAATLLPTSLAPRARPSECPAVFGPH